MVFGAIRKRYQALPLRAKLTLLNTLVVVLVSVVSLVAVRQGLRWMLLKELNVSLEDELFETALAADRIYDSSEDIFEQMEQSAAGHIRHGWFLQLFDASGERELWSSVNTPSALHAPAGTKADPAVDGEGEGSAYRFAQRKVGSAGGPSYLMRVGTSLDFVQRDVENVTRIITPVLIFVLIAAPIGGYLLARRATAPLQTIIVKSRQFHPSRLDERLPVRATGDELDQLSTEINNFLNQIFEHLRRNREFVANAAHELRSPLSAIMTSAEVALSRARSPEQYQELLTTIHDECEQLGGLVNQLLLLAESDAGLLERYVKPVDLDEVVDSSLAMFAGVAEEKGIELVGDVTPDVEVLGETTKMRQVVNNLIDNAIKYTPGGGRVDVRVHRNRLTGQAVLSVRDTGIGIPAEHLPFIFDRFYQVNPARDHDDVVHDTGLGLSICRAVVEAFGGQIDVDSQVGRGTTFTVAFPNGSRAAPDADAGDVEPQLLVGDPAGRVS